MGNLSIRREGCSRASCKMAGKKLAKLLVGFLIMRLEGIPQ